ARRSTRPQAIARTGLAAVAVAGVLALIVSAFTPLETGALGGTTRTVPEADSFQQLDAIFSTDTSYGSVVWFGGASITENSNGGEHRFFLRSQRHPVTELMGDGEAGDPLSQFCRSPQIEFCYLDRPLFIYV